MKICGEKEKLSLKASKLQKAILKPKSESFDALADALDLGSSPKGWGVKSLYPHQNTTYCVYIFYKILYIVSFIY